MGAGIRTVAVVGAGVMGQGIAQLAAQAGHWTLLYDLSAEAVEEARQKIAQALARRVDKGRMSADESIQVQRRIRPVATIEGLAGADLVIEAVVEQLGVKHDLVRQLETVCSNRALICSNTSSLSIGDIASQAHYPERIAGLHFFNPAPVMKLVEVVVSSHTGPHVAEELAKFARSLGKTPVTVQDSPGFIVNRCARPYYSEALIMLEQGVADAATIDGCLKANAGMPLGPFELMDLVGLDVSQKATETIWRAFDRHPRFAPSETVQHKVASNQLGRKTGSGFYQYPRERAEAHTRASVESAGALAEHLSRHLQVPVAVSDGRPAHERVVREGRGCLLLDQNLLDWRDGPVILAYSCAGLSAETCREAERLARAAGIDLKAVADKPGLIVQRVVAMLYDEASRAVQDGVAAKEDIDIAMQLGLNFRLGPLALAETLGISTMQRIRERLAKQGPEGRYS